MDPFILFSRINTMLRDQYTDLDELCAAEGFDKAELTRTLADAGFEYMPEVNQFR